MLKNFRIYSSRLPPRILLTMLVPFLLVGVGTVGYHFLEGLTYFESLYLTVITLTTIGYGDIYPQKPEGRTFTMILVLGGVFTLFYAATATIRAIVSGELAELWGKQQMERTLAGIRDHIIVCGFGRMGRTGVPRFFQGKDPFCRHR